MDKNREINVMFLSGDTGTGKTSFAKQYCQSLKKSYCVSSSSNDVMQDYKGEDVLILDDLRDSDFKFTDLLKILDNHTKSTVKSRYHNKAFIGDTIVITSYKPLQDWYFDVPSESKHQLYRRIKQMYKFNNDKIDCFEYNERSFKYEFVGTAPNVIAMKKREQAKMAIRMFDAMGIEFTAKDKIVDLINNKSEEEWELMDLEPVDDDDSNNPFNK